MRPATMAGYAALAGWLRGFGESSWSEWKDPLLRRRAGPASASGGSVVEVDRPDRRAGSLRKANPTRLAQMPLRGLHLFDGVPTGRSCAAWSQFDHITMNIYAHVLDESTRRSAAQIDSLLSEN